MNTKTSNRKRGLTHTQRQRNPSAVGASMEIPSVKVLVLKTEETQRLHSFLLKIALLREGLRFDSIAYGSAYSAIQSLKVLSYEHVAISCPSEEISSPITLPSWPARVFSGDQPGWVQILAVLS